MEVHMLTRRQFIAHSGSLISATAIVPTMLCRAAYSATASRDESVLVVIQLDGGNDGLNTVVPYDDDAYVRARPKLHIAAKDVHKLSDVLGLHPRMRAAKELFDDGRLTIIQGVGYPNPDKSHFRSMRIWQTASFDEAAHNSYGWLGRALDGANQPVNSGESAAVFVGDEQVPATLWSRRSATTALSRIDDLTLVRPIDHRSPGDDQTRGESLSQFVTRQVLSAYSAADQIARKHVSATHEPTYPESALANRLKLISQLLKTGSRARVYYAIQTGYDTHAGQMYPHGQLLAEFSQALKAFLDDLKTSELAERVVVLAFSEFGRRVAENDSLGTDHGAAGPVFLAGKPVHGGLVGAAQDLASLERDDLPLNIDFRQVYATLLDQWLGIPSATILGGRFEHLPLIDG
jgi:uncharacterized protein (DUF1501 family)